MVVPALVLALALAGSDAMKSLTLVPSFTVTEMGSTSVTVGGAVRYVGVVRRTEPSPLVSVEAAVPL